MSDLGASTLLGLGAELSIKIDIMFFLTLRFFFLALASTGKGLRQLYFQSSKFSWQKTSVLPGVLRLLKSNFDGDGDVSLNFDGDGDVSSNFDGDGDVSFSAASARNPKPSLPIQGEVVALLLRLILDGGVRPVHAS